MNRVWVPPELRERVSDDGTQVFLANMQLASVPEWLRNLTALTELDLSVHRIWRFFGLQPRYRGAALPADRTPGLGRDVLAAAPATPMAAART